MQRARDAYINGIDTIEEYSESKAILRERAEKLREAIAHAQKTEAVPPARHEAMDCDKIANALKNDSIDPLRKANALRDVIDRLEWNQEAVHLKVVLSN